MEEKDGEKAVPEEKVPSCMKFMQYWRKCTSATNHFHHYYVYGEFPVCTEEKENIKTCFKYKATRSDETKEKIFAAMKKVEDRDNFVEKPSSGVWEFRENPAEDWLKKGS